MKPIDADALKQDLLKKGFYPAIVKCALEAAPTIEQPKWISCTERLPIEGASIEMFFPITQTICLGYYKKIAKMAFWCINLPDGTGRIADNKPTYWRYRYIVETLQPPKGDE